MKRFLGTFAAVLIPAALVSAGLAYAAETQDTINQPASSLPELKQKIGTNEAAMGPTRYPTFTAADPTYAGDQACADYLLAQPGISNSKLPDNLTSQKDFEPVAGLVIKDLVIDEANRGTSKLLITWTIRVEGEGLPPHGCTFTDANGNVGYDVWNCICKPRNMGWHGTTTQLFKGGQVKSRLFVNGVDTEIEASMTMPDAVATTVTQVYDPTITGSFLLTKDFPAFKGAFPKKIDSIEIRWYNDTALKIKSPANQRSLIVKIMPVTASN